MGRLRHRTGILFVIALMAASSANGASPDTQSAASAVALPLASLKPTPMRDMDVATAWKFLSPFRHADPKTWR